MNVGSVRARPGFERETTPDDDRKPVSDFSALVIAIADGNEPKKQSKEPANIEGLFSSGSPASPASHETGRRGDAETGSAEEAARRPRAVDLGVDVDVEGDGNVEVDAPTSSSTQTRGYRERAHESAITSKSPSPSKSTTTITTTTTSTATAVDAEVETRTASPLPRQREGKGVAPTMRTCEEPSAQQAPDPNLAIALARLLDRATVPSSQPAATNHTGAAQDAPLPPPPRLPFVKPRSVEAKAELIPRRELAQPRAEQAPESKQLDLATPAKTLDVSLPAVLGSGSELAPRPSHELQQSAPGVQRPREGSSAPAFEARTSSDDRSSEERGLDQGSPERSDAVERNSSEVVATDTRTTAISPVRPAPQASPFAVAVNVATQLVGQGSSAGSVVGFAELASEIERLGSLSASAEGSSADFELQHPELGKVRVALSVKGAEIELRILAPDPATAMRLSANDANLRRALASAGLRVMGLRVDVDGRPATREQRVRRRRGLDMEA